MNGQTIFDETETFHGIKDLIKSGYPGVNFINILHAAFTCADPKSIKFLSSFPYLFALLRRACIKAAHKMLMKSTPGLDWYNTTDGRYAQIFRVSPLLLDTIEFSGQISDFNFWSRTLTNQEIAQFSSGCQYDFETISKPDLLKWSKINITYSSTKNYDGIQVSISSMLNE